MGQDQAVRAISDAVRRSRSGLGDPRRPLGSFMLLGPTGVGKTELCKSLAEFLFDTEEAMVRIDMSEFLEQHSVARPDRRPSGVRRLRRRWRILLKPVHRRPYSVILFDEIEKAHHDVFNLLLQVLDDGRLTDGHGRVIDFKNTLIVMTSNLGSDKLHQLAESGGSDIEIEMAVKDILKAHFRPEFLNRVDETLVFHRLDKVEVRKIAKIQIEHLRQRLLASKIEMEVSDAALDLLAEEGYDPAFGARPLKRLIQQQIENPLAKRLLAGEFTEGDRVLIDVGGAMFTFNRSGQPMSV